MKRRTFALAAAATALPATFLAGLPARAQSGKPYKELTPPVPVDTPPGQIEVIEFFSYACPFCKQFEPSFEAWIKTVPKNVTLQRVHVGWNMDGLMAAPLQRIYYSLQALEQVGALQAKVFNALQTEHKRLDQPNVLFDWVAQQGVDRAKFEQAYNSFGVANQIERAARTTDAYRVESTPSLAIAGRFVTDPGLAKGFEPMLKLTDTLIAQARQANKPA